MRSLFFLLSGLITLACADTILVTVGGNTTQNASFVFSPESVVAKQGDVVLFNFTQGNHTVTQSTFASPCIPAHDTNSTINGFDSSFRDANNGTSITTLSVPVTNPNVTIWFYDVNTCALGGVGGININTSSTETLDGFRRNAIRLNGTAPTFTSFSGSQGATGPTSSIPEPTSASSANRAVVVGGLVSLPLLVILFGLFL